MPTISQTPSRRKFITTVAAAAAVISSAGLPESAIASQCSYPDLAAEFDALYRRWSGQRAKDEAQQSEFEALVTAATGIERGHRM
jgi:hypothetical protein